MSEMKAYQERNTARLDRMAVVKAMQHLTTLKKIMQKLKIKNNKNSFQESTIEGLKQERQYLIANRTAYQEATWRLAAGQKVKERERGIFAIYDRQSKNYIPIDLPPDPLPLSFTELTGAHFVTMPQDIEFDGITVKAGEQVWIKPHKGDKGDSGEPGYINLKPGDRVLVKNRTEGPDYTGVVGDPVLPKSKTNKLTTEQRRANGARGAAVRDENKRKKLALDAGHFHVYAKRGKRIARIGTYYKSMRGAFNFLRHFREKDTTVEFIVYDNKGQRWEYDNEVHNLTLKH